MIGLKVEGAEDAARQLGNTGERARVALVKGLFAAAMIVRNAAVKGIAKGPKSGRIYRRRSVRHQASAVGEYPAGDTGNLARSIHHMVDPIKLEGRVEAAANYAVPLEYKAPSRGGRPFLTRAYTENVEAIQLAIQAALFEALAAADRKANRK